jgi:hypothetical protein
MFVAVPAGTTVVTTIAGINTAYIVVLAAVILRRVHIATTTTGAAPPGGDVAQRHLLTKPRLKVRRRVDHATANTAATLTTVVRVLIFRVDVATTPGSATRSRCCQARVGRDCGIILLVGWLPGGRLQIRKLVDVEPGLLPLVVVDHHQVAPVVPSNLSLQDDVLLVTYPRSRHAGGSTFIAATTATTAAIAAGRPSFAAGVAAEIKQRVQHHGSLSCLTHTQCAARTAR